MIHDRVIQSMETLILLYTLPEGFFWAVATKFKKEVVAPHGHLWSHLCLQDELEHQQ